MMQLPMLFLLLVSWGGEFALTRTAKPPIVVRATGQVAKEVTIGRPLPQQSAFGLKRGDILSLQDAKGLRILKGPGVLADGKFISTGSSSRDGVDAMATTDAAGAIEKAGVADRPSQSGFSFTKPKPGSEPKPSRAESHRAPVDKLAYISARRPARRPQHVRELSEGDWIVDLSDASLICLPEGAKPVLYRRDASSQAKVEIEASRKSETFVWGEGDQVAPWPFAVTPGQTNTLSVDAGEPKIVQIIGLETFEPTVDRPFGVHPSCGAQVELNARVREEQALLETAARTADEIVEELDRD